MSSVLIFFIICGAVATVLFIAGYARGVQGALRDYDDDTIETDTSGDLNAKWWMFGAAVLAATAVIMLVGTAPIFIYLGPFLAIVTAALNGLAFFVDRSSDAG